MMQIIGIFIYALLSFVSCRRPDEAGGVMHMLNHACDPNCACVEKILDKNQFSLIYAKTDIEAGSELTWDYNQVTNVKEEELRCRCKEGCPNFVCRFVSK